MKVRFFFDSARLMPGCGRYSFIAIDPFLILQTQGEDAFSLLENELKKFPLSSHPDLPPFQGGAAGFFSYDLCHQLEKLPAAYDDMHFPDLMVGLYDLVVAFDHELQRAWIFSSGYPEQLSEKRLKRAEVRCEWLLDIIKKISPLPSCSTVVCQIEDIQSNFSRQQYEDAVSKVIDYILAGDIFEANISQRFRVDLPAGLTAFDLYRRLRLVNAAPFSAYLNFVDVAVVSASPERFLKLTEGEVETRPIKGTRARGMDPVEDIFLATELLASEKDRAENVMIVDLLRNDLSKVCEDSSVVVPQLCGLESYTTVHHLVSVVKGVLKEECNVIDLLRATFPGGSITGAPKIRSMEIIAEIEPTCRGPYCGCIGYIGFNGDFDSSIAIRTYAIKDNQVVFQAGGAVVADSDPAAEYLETLTKANALLRALTEGDV
jgi:para-aminobenzoate synthetase component 1